MVLRNEFRDGFGEFGGERGPVRGRPESHLGIHRKSGEALPGLLRAAKFDHALFCQGEAPAGWEESPGHATSFVKVKETLGIVEPNAHFYRKVMKGTFANKDIGI